MDHDVKAVANVVFKLARADKRYLTALDFQRVAALAQNLCVKTLGEKLFQEHITYVGFQQRPYIRELADAYGGYKGGLVKTRLETRTHPIKEETPAWKVIRAAYTQFDTEAHNVTANGGTTTVG